MDLFREVLDTELLDRHKRRIGRVDGLTLELRDGQPPRVLAMEVGAATLADRLPPPVGRWIRALLARTLPMSIETACISMDAIHDIGVDIDVSVDAERDPQFLRTEKWLRRVVRRIPGGHKGARTSER